MNQDDAVSAFRRADLVLVGPPSVICARLSFEEIRFLRVRRRIIDEHHQRLAVRIETFVVIPSILGRDDTMTDEDHVGVDRARCRLRLIGGNKIVTMFQRPNRCRAFFRKREARLRRVHGDAEERDALVVGAVVAGGLEAVRLELRRDVLHREIVTSRAWAATLEQIAGEEFVVRAHRIRAERLQCGRNRCGSGDEDQSEQRQTSHESSFRLGGRIRDERETAHILRQKLQNRG